jgi:hypothetical protein
MNLPLETAGTSSSPSVGSRAGFWLFAFCVALGVVPSSIGFIAKFIQLIIAFRTDEEGAFAIVPILNYLFATVGFLCMLFWAISRGMFNEADRQKIEFFDREKMLGEFEGETDVPTLNPEAAR